MVDLDIIYLPPTVELVPLPKGFQFHHLGRQQTDGSPSALEIPCEKKDRSKQSLQGWGVEQGQPSPAAVQDGGVGIQDERLRSLLLSFLLVTEGLGLI